MVYIINIVPDIQFNSIALSSVQLASCAHPAKRLNTLVHRHLRAVPVLKLQLLVFLTTFSHIIVNPVECISHVVVVLSHARSIADCVGDDSAVRLDEVDLSKEQSISEAIM